MISFITDRTEADVLLGNAKGRYDYTDLNRVENDVVELVKLAKEANIHFSLQVKTDWARPGIFSQETWPTQSQMERYLRNVWTLATEFAAQAGLPDSMQSLDWEAANHIEAALELVHIRLQGILTSYLYSGELYAGEENAL